MRRRNWEGKATGVVMAGGMCGRSVPSSGRDSRLALALRTAPPGRGVDGGGGPPRSLAGSLCNSTPGFSLSTTTGDPVTVDSCSPGSTGAGRCTAGKRPSAGGCSGLLCTGQPGRRRTWGVCPWRAYRNADGPASPGVPGARPAADTLGRAPTTVIRRVSSRVFQRVETVAYEWYQSQCLQKTGSCGCPPFTTTRRFRGPREGREYREWARRRFGDRKGASSGSRVADPVTSPTGSPVAGGRDPWYVPLVQGEEVGRKPGRFGSTAWHTDAVPWVASSGLPYFWSPAHGRSGSRRSLRGLTCCRTSGLSNTRRYAGAAARVTVMLVSGGGPVAVAAAEAEGRRTHHQRMIASPRTEWSREFAPAPLELECRASAGVSKLFVRSPAHVLINERWTFFFLGWGDRFFEFVPGRSIPKFLSGTDRAEMARPEGRGVVKNERIHNFEMPMALAAERLRGGVGSDSLFPAIRLPGFCVIPAFNGLFSEGSAFDGPGMDILAAKRTSHRGFWLAGDERRN